ADSILLKEDSPVMPPAAQLARMIFLSAEIFVKTCFTIA
ncbi:MAG: hypothetical protein ACI9PX_000851, partial [Reinekea sp.]